MRADAAGFSAGQVQAAEADFREKNNNLQHWRSVNVEESQKVADAWAKSTDRTSNAFKNWLTNTATTAQKAAVGFDEMNRSIKGVGDAVLDTAGKVHTLTGEWISLDEAKKRFETGGSMAVTSQNFDEVVRSFLTAGGQNRGMVGVHLRADPWDLAKQGYSYAEIMQIITSTGSGPIPPPIGPRIPGFAGGVRDFRGGPAIVGEEGPEMVVLPQHASVFRTRAGIAGGVSAAPQALEGPARAGSGGGVRAVHIGQGAFTFQWPIIDNPRDLDKLADIAGDAFLRKLRMSGAL
jgi:hypothetical protein